MKKVTTEEKKTLSPRQKQIIFRSRLKKLGYIALGVGLTLGIGYVGHLDEEVYKAEAGIKTETENVFGTENMDFYYDLCSEYADCKVINAENLTNEQLESRNGSLIIERVIGKVTTETGDGVVLNDSVSNYYISYENVDGVQKGNIICTYMVYNPDTNYVDDIIERYDYIIDDCME